MRNLLKFMKRNILGIIIGIFGTITIGVTASIIIPAESVSYSNSKTSETTVEGALNELFSSVEINEKIGSTDISSISDGTITGAIKDLYTASLKTTVHTMNPVSDLNNFYGTALFYGDIANLPPDNLASDDWFLVISSGDICSTVQIAISLWDGSIFHRHRSACNYYDWVLKVE